MFAHAKAFQKIAGNLPDPEKYRLFIDLFLIKVLRVGLYLILTRANRIMFLLFFFLLQLTQF